MKSMTGYGKSVYEGKDYYIEMELKSVNSRFLEIRLTLPRELSFMEIEVNNLIKKRISRGKVSARLNFISFTPPKLKINETKLTAFHNIYEKIKKHTESKEDIPLNVYLENEEIVLNNEDQSDNNELKGLIINTINACIDKYHESVDLEGQSMQDFLFSSVERINSAIEIIEKHYPTYKEKVQKRLNETAENVLGISLSEDDFNRIALEIALYVEKADINEEIVRIKHHSNKFQSTLKGDGDLGKKLNFILQEMHREINTIGSKYNENDIFDHIICVKEEIEKCREMVQNIV